jgi:hypothetical protein
MNATIDIGVNTVKNIGSNVNQGVYRHQLMDDSVSSLKPRSLVVFQTLRTAGICVQLDLAPLPDTKLPSTQLLAV